MHRQGDDRTAPASLRPEPVEDRPGVGVVRPEDYSGKDRAASNAAPVHDEDKEYEKLNPGGSGRTPSVHGSGRDRDNA